jgi:hypothetical protein
VVAIAVVGQVWGCGSLKHRGLHVHAARAGTQQRPTRSERLTFPKHVVQHRIHVDVQVVDARCGQWDICILVVAIKPAVEAGDTHDATSKRVFELNLVTGYTLIPHATPRQGCLAPAAFQLLLLLQLLLPN